MVPIHSVMIKSTLTRSEKRPIALGRYPTNSRYFPKKSFGPNINHYKQNGVVLFLTGWVVLWMLLGGYYKQNKVVIVCHLSSL